MNFFKGLDSDLREGLKNALTLSWGHSLCLMEGYSLTQDQAQHIILNTQPDTDAPTRDVLRLVAVKHAIRRAFELSGNGGLTLSDICELHRLCGHEVSSKWRWRDVNKDPLYLTAQNRMRDWTIRASHVRFSSLGPNDVLGVLSDLHTSFLRTHAFDRSMITLASLTTNIIAMRQGIMPSYPAPRVREIYLETLDQTYKASHELGKGRQATEEILNNRFIIALSSGMGVSYHLLVGAHTIQAKRLAAKNVVTLVARAPKPE